MLRLLHLVLHQKLISYVSKKFIAIDLKKLMKKIIEKKKRFDLIQKKNFFNASVVTDTIFTATHHPNSTTE